MLRTIMIMAAVALSLNTAFADVFHEREVLNHAARFLKANPLPKDVKSHPAYVISHVYANTPELLFVTNLTDALRKKAKETAERILATGYGWKGFDEKNTATAEDAYYAFQAINGLIRTTDHLPDLKTDPKSGDSEAVQEHLGLINGLIDAAITARKTPGAFHFTAENAETFKSWERLTENADAEVKKDFHPEHINLYVSHAAKYFHEEALRKAAAASEQRAKELAAEAERNLRALAEAKAEAARSEAAKQAQELEAARQAAEAEAEAARLKAEADAQAAAATERLAAEKAGAAAKEEKALAKAQAAAAKALEEANAARLKAETDAQQALAEAQAAAAKALEEANAARSEAAKLDAKLTEAQQALAAASPTKPGTHSATASIAGTPTTPTKEQGGQPVGAGSEEESKVMPNASGSGSAAPAPATPAKPQRTETGTSALGSGASSASAPRTGAGAGAGTASSQTKKPKNFAHATHKRAVEGLNLVRSFVGADPLPLPPSRKPGTSPASPTPSATAGAETRSTTPQRRVRDELAAAAAGAGSSSGTKPARQ